MTLQQLIDTLVHFCESVTDPLPEGITTPGDLPVTIVTSKSRGMHPKDIWRSKGGIEIEVGHES